MLLDISILSKEKQNCLFDICANFCQILWKNCPVFSHMRLAVNGVFSCHFLVPKDTNQHARTFVANFRWILSLICPFWRL